MEKRGNLTSLIERCLARGSESLSAVASVSVILMMVQITADVVLKYMFHKPIAGTIEIIAYYYMPAAIFFPLAFAERHRRHITVTLFTQRFAPRRIAGFDVFSGLVSTLYVSLLTWSSVTSAILHTRQGEELDATFFYVPIWPARWFLPVGAALFALYLLLHVVQDARVALGGAPPWQGGG
ncbi:MAG: TRAP transporter small permease subunit, partial [Ktedonobacteraceae bacterium]